MDAGLRDGGGAVYDRDARARVRLAAAQKHCPVQIFATDVDENSLEVGRKRAIYPESIAADDLPRSPGAPSFQCSDDALRPSRQGSCAEAVIFALQNLLSDPPFMKLDLISCHNLLTVYLEPDVQKRLIAMFHFALNEGGYLFLGTVRDDRPADRSVRAGFEEMADLSPHRPGPARSDRIPRRPRAAIRNGREWGFGATRAGRRSRPIAFAELTHTLLLEEFAPASVLINRNHEVLYYFGPTRRCLHQPTEGAPTQDYAAAGPRGDAHQAAGGRLLVHPPGPAGGRVRRDFESRRRVGGRLSDRSAVHRVQRGRVSAAGVVSGDASAPPAAPPPPAESGLEDSLVGQLEGELRAAKEELQSTIEELESSNEEPSKAPPTKNRCR